MFDGLPSVLALGVLVGSHLGAHRFRHLSNAPRSRLLSVGSGVSLAYVFLQLLPEIAHGQNVLKAQFADDFPLRELGIYLVAMIGLLGFYGLERAVQHDTRIGEGADGTPQQDAGAETSHPLFWLHLGMFALYSLIVGCLLSHTPDGAAYESANPTVRLAVFTFAIAFHFVVVDFGLRLDFPSGWRRVGRWVLSGALVLGWAYGRFGEVSEFGLLLLTAFLGGGILLNVLKEELPQDRHSRFWWLFLGAGLFTGLMALV